jgi:hypothetical protein
MPPMSIHTALSVGEPEKNLETSELNEFVALMPVTIRTMPPTSRAREMSLLIKSFNPSMIYRQVSCAFHFRLTPLCARK